MIDTSSCLMQRSSQELRLGALVLSVAAFFLYIAAEVVSESAWTLIAIGALSFAWTGPLTLLAGSLQSSTFRWWMPFEGGLEFIFLQTIGWTLHTLSLTAAVVSVANVEKAKWFDGQYLFLGVISFSAQILLNLSLNCCDKPPRHSFSTFHPSVDTTGTLSSNRPRAPWKSVKAALGLLLATSGALMFILIEVDEKHTLHTSSVLITACIEFIISAVLIHVGCGWRDVPGYKLWQPFEGGRMFLLVQYIGWQLFACSLAGALLLITVEDSTTGSMPVYSVGTIAFIGVNGLVSQILLLLSLQYFRPYATDAPSKFKSHEDHFLRNRPRQLYVSVIMCVWALAGGALSHCARAEALPSAMNRFVQGHTLALWKLYILSIALATPVAHTAGLRSCAGYQVWQPFRGGAKFVFLQTIGWLWYGFFLALSIVLCLNRDRMGELPSLFVLGLGVAAAFAIGVSLSYFVPSDTSLRPAVGNRPRSASMDKPDSAKGENAMVILCCLSSLVVHAIVDMYKDEMHEPLQAFILTIGVSMIIIASIVAQFSGTRLYDKFRLWQPFEGGSDHVIRQGLGWTLFAVDILFESLALLHSTGELPTGVYSLLGVFGIFPPMCLLWSMTSFQLSPEPSTCTDQVLERNTSVLSDIASLKWRAAVNIFITVGSSSLLAASEFLRGVEYSFPVREVMYSFGCASSVVGMLLTHGASGPALHPAYTFYQPFRGGLRFVTMQGVAWTILSVALIFSITILCWREVLFKVAGVHFASAAMYGIAQLLLLYSIPLFRPNDAGLEEVSTSIFYLPKHMKSQVQDIGRLLIGLFIGVSACSVLVLVDAALLYVGPKIPVFPLTACAVVALFSSVPMTYQYVTKAHPKDTKPFGGSIVLIVVGYALWSFTLLLGALFAYNVWTIEEALKHEPTLSPQTGYMGTFAGSVGVLAQVVLLHASDDERQISDKKAATRCLFRWPLVGTASASTSKYASAAFAVVIATCITRLERTSMSNFDFAHLVLILCSAGVVSVSYFFHQRIVLPASTAGAQISHKTEVATKTLSIELPEDIFVRIVDFLQIADVVAFTSTCKELRRLDDASLWKEIFMATMSINAISHRTRQAPALRLSWKVDNATALRTTSFADTALCRSESTCIRVIGNLPEQSTPKPMHWTKDAWRFLCLGRELQECLMHCVVCEQVEYISRQVRKWELTQNCPRHVPTTWITLCECTDPISLSRIGGHRVCLEKYAIDKDKKLLESSLRCPICNSLKASASARVPLTMLELVETVVKDVRSEEGLFDQNIFTVPMTSFFVAYGFQQIGWGCLALYCWIVYAMAICFITNTPRFERCIEKIGDASSLPVQIIHRLYNILTLSTVIHLLWCSPTVSSEDAAWRSWAWMNGISWFFQLNCVVFVLVANLSIYLYWRAGLKVPTVQGLELNLKRDVASDDAKIDGTKSCALCLLQFCDTSED